MRKDFPCLCVLRYDKAPILPTEIECNYNNISINFRNILYACNQRPGSMIPCITMIFPYIMIIEHFILTLSVDNSLS